MGTKALVVLSVCLLASGLVGVALGDDPGGHKEPKNVAAACLVTSATVSWDAVNDAHLSGYDVYRKAASDSTYTRANSALVTTTAYVVTGLSSGISYNFAVMAMY